jgi:hypothetical protein
VIPEEYEVAGATRDSDRTADDMNELTPE